MTAEIIQFVPRPNPNRQLTLEQQAIGIVDFINGLTAIDNSNHSILYNGEGIDGMLPKEPA